jgi:hypothetical protein
MDPHIINNSLMDSSENATNPYSEDIDSNSGRIVDPIRETSIDASPIHIRTERTPEIINRIPAIFGIEILLEFC